MLSEDQISRAFCFEHEDRGVLYPVRMRRRGARAPRFQIWQVDKHHTEDVEEAEMVRKVLGENYAVRMCTLDGGHRNGYRPHGRSIRRVRTDC